MISASRCSSATIARDGALGEPTDVQPGGGRGGQIRCSLVDENELGRAFRVVIHEQSDCRRGERPAKVVAMPDRPLSITVLLSTLVFIVAFATLPLRAAVPTAPTNLAASVSGLSVNLVWEASANSPTQYIIQAGSAPGLSNLAQIPVSASRTSFGGSAGSGTYYVRVVAVNADGVSTPSNEVVVTLTSGCFAPSAPLNLRAIIRGTEAYIFWRAPLAGTAANYSLQVGAAPGQTFTQFTTGGTTLNANVATGTYFLRVIATNPCGNSAASNELQISFPSNTVRVADPDPGTVLGMPDIAALVNRIHNENPGLVNNSCPTGRKYESNPWLDRIVDRLRTYDTRFGYNAKPTRTSADNNGFPVIAAGDEMTFFAGRGVAERSPDVYAFDILSDHCGTRPAQDVFRNISPEPAAWTGAGRFVGDQQ
jgi:hypothetical protein